MIKLLDLMALIPGFICMEPGMSSFLCHFHLHGMGNCQNKTKIIRSNRHIVTKKLYLCTQIRTNIEEQ